MTQAGCGADATPAATTVVAVLDGRTVEVERDGATSTVTLAGLLVPAPDECLGEESAAALGDLLKTGTEVRLEPSDPAGGSEDIVAAVFADDVLVSAELVRLGLAYADPTEDVPAQVTAAQEEAIDASAGLFGVGAPCTLPAQVEALEQATAEAADAAAALAAGAGIVEVDRHGSALAAAAATGAALAALLDGEQSARYPGAMVATWRSRTVAVNERLAGVTATVQQVRASEEQRIEGERVAAEAAAAQAAADEAARQAQAAADAEAARVAAEAAAVQTKAPTGGSVHYQNCDAVRAAGADPIYAGDPGYSGKLDRDGDGVGCEK
ncbi:excalibur calcium-binding domain-containing protein [Cellulomonas xylanilytica]|nr:excalibur calcium-binding domain-containing protein [Cellulomonas xylanilytica]